MGNGLKCSIALLPNELTLLRELFARQEKCDKTSSFGLGGT